MTCLETCDIFPTKQSSNHNKGNVMTILNLLVAYCKEGEEDSLRSIDTKGCLPDQEEIEFPIARDWSAIPARYERRRETWARNKSFSDWN